MAIYKTTKSFEAYANYHINAQMYKKLQQTMDPQSPSVLQRNWSQTKSYCWNSS